ncbi:ComEC/Rec2 family competence protein [Ferdinandcohnia quinoae]|uniref:Uncharacterized protein n=1 Tax=Fredinandcohnia quinoae TaxID=2918902 RepID=A0AAW5E538_9BACI|nr:hypothetical protein [Fredinandcohnia sp. SECRCQ15]MCH1624715.1 hypothetical protein [Fredinandcohnia sp. SECRCQ15]
MKKVVFVFISIGLLLLSLPNKTSATIEKINIKLSDDEIAMTFLNLSDGESTLIHLPNGENVLVNTGGEGTKKELEELLVLYNVTKLTTIILTKDEPEFIANLGWLVERYKKAKIVIGSHFSNSLILPNNPKTLWENGDVYHFSKNHFVKVMNESKDSSGSLGMDLMFQFGTNETLYMTSSNSELEKSMQSIKGLPNTNILKVADFGSQRGTTERFVSYVDPQIAIIFHKRGQLPSQDVLERLNSTWIDIYYTKQFGNVTIKYNGTNYEVIPFP